MSTMQETKRRIHSVNVTKKITKAMQLVATSKIMKAKKNLKEIQEYYLSVSEVFQDLLLNIKENDLSKVFPKKSSPNTLYVVITSDLGLCGGYNSNVLKLLKVDLKQNDKIIVIGKKGVSHLNSLSIPIINSFVDVSDKPNYNYASIISQLAIPMFLNGEVSSIKLVYTKFINSITFEPKIKRLLPIDIENLDIKKNTNEDKIKPVFEFLPSIEVILFKSLPLFISTFIYGALVESKLSEASSRRIAMENATDNATELISKLQLQYNRARQSAITQEISEIVAGSQI